MRVIVTGGAGFIGSALVRHLVLEKGYEVLNIDALTYAGYLPSLTAVEGKANYRFLHANICDGAAMAAGDCRLSAGPDHAPGGREPRRPFDHRCRGFHPHERDRDIHACSRQRATIGRASKTGRSRRSASSMYRPTKSMDRSARMVSLPRIRPTTQARPIRPQRPRPIISRRAWQRTYGLPVVVSNCSNNYGPYHFPEKLIPLTILNALAGEPLPVYGKGENVRDWLYVEDHARALDLIAERGRVGETYNVGGRNERRNIDVVRRICDVLDTLMPGNLPREELIDLRH